MPAKKLIRGTADLHKNTNILLILVRVRELEFICEGMGKSTSIKSSNKAFQVISKGLGRKRLLNAPEIEEESRREILVEPSGVRLKSPQAIKELGVGFFSQRLLECFIFPLAVRL